MSSSEQQLSGDLLRFIRSQVDTSGPEYPIRLREVTRRLEQQAAGRDRTEAEQLLGQLRDLTYAAEEGEPDPVMVGTILGELVTLFEIELPEMIPETAIPRTELRQREGASRTRGPALPPPGSPAERLGLIRTNWALIRELVADHRVRVQLQRDILLEQVARAAMKPDFARSRQWARGIPGVFPREQSWDDDWFAGDDPPGSPSHGAAQRRTRASEAPDEEKPETGGGGQQTGDPLKA